MKHTFTAPINIWISQYSGHDADSLQTVDDVSGLAVWEGGYEPSSPGYTKVGTGTVTVEIASRDEIITGKVGALRAELERDRADSQVRQNALIRKISELEALTYSPSEVA